MQALERHPRNLKQHVNRLGRSAAFQAILNSEAILAEYKVKYHTEKSWYIFLVIGAFGEQALEICQILETLGYEDHGLLAPDQVGAMVSLDRREDLEMWVKGLVALLEDALVSQVAVGVSPYFQDIEDFRTASQIASIASKACRFMLGKPHYCLAQRNLPAVMMASPEIGDRLLRLFDRRQLQVLLQNQELKHTLECFFTNNLNLSDAAQKLFIHRNTLIYRLNKIHKATGYDPRSFEDAMNLSALMVLVSSMEG